MSSRQTNQSLSSLINNVLFIISSVTSAMLVMSDTPVVICSYVSSVRKHYDNRHPGRIPDDLDSCFKVLKKCQNKFDCLVNEMLLIKQL